MQHNRFAWGIICSLSGLGTSHIVPRSIGQISWVNAVELPVFDVDSRDSCRLHFTVNFLRSSVSRHVGLGRRTAVGVS